MIRTDPRRKGAPAPQEPLTQLRVVAMCASAAPVRVFSGECVYEKGVGEGAGSEARGVGKVSMKLFFLSRRSAAVLKWWVIEWGAGSRSGKRNVVGESGD